MLKRLKNVFTQEKSLHQPEQVDGIAVSKGVAEMTASDWIAAHALFFKAAAGGPAFSLSGLVSGKPWKVDRAAKPRNYIAGQELRGRVDIDANPQITVVIMNRALKELLENRAYALYTDSIETEASPALMEEMRWLASYPEVGWQEPPDSFWARYAVMSDRRSNAIKWLTPDLIELLMAWPQPAPSADVPLMMMLMRGKMHMRMQWGQADEHLMAHAVKLLLDASQRAAAAFPR